jgi:hypothetical protein
VKHNALPIAVLEIHEKNDLEPVRESGLCSFPEESSPEPAPQSNTMKTQTSCVHERWSVSELVARTARLNPRVTKVSALVCDDCGRVLITDSVSHNNQILKLIEALEERVSALEGRSQSGSQGLQLAA